MDGRSSVSLPLLSSVVAAKTPLVDVTVDLLTRPSSRKTGPGVSPWSGPLRVTEASLLTDEVPTRFLDVLRKVRLAVSMAPSLIKGFAAGVPASVRKFAAVGRFDPFRPA